MQFELSESQQSIVDAAKRLTATHLWPVLERNPANCPLPKAEMLEIYRHLSEFGITVARLPADYGGGQLSMLDYGLIMEQLPAVVALSLLSHDGSVARLCAGADPMVRKDFLPELIAGRKIACTATSEQSAGSDSNAIQTRLDIQGEQAFITGRKIWITNASICDIFVVTCTVGTDDKGRSITRRVLVERDDPSIHLQEIPLTGLRQGHLCEVEFDQTKVPTRNIIGLPGDAGKYMTLVWNANRPLIGLMSLALAQRAFDLAKEFASVRTQFGRSLARTQLVQQDLADIETAIISGRLMCLNALDCLDRGLRVNGMAAMAKRFATKAATKAIDLAMQIHGALGVTEELGLDQLWRDARVFQVPDGTTGILALIQGREITGHGAFS